MIVDNFSVLHQAEKICVPMRLHQNLIHTQSTLHAHTSLMQFSSKIGKSNLG